MEKNCTSLQLFLAVVKVTLKTKALNSQGISFLTCFFCIIEK